jgi:hypothetical protein
MEEPNILIKTALSDAVRHVNEGMAPTEALKKVANDLDLNPNYIQRTGEALNVALHYKHFKTASDRSADFDIADIPKAVQETFTLTEKTAKQYEAEHFSVSDANTAVFNYNRAISNPVYKQAFLEISGAKEVHESFPTTFDKVYEKSANYIEKLAKAVDSAEVAKFASELELNDKFAALTTQFRKDAGYRTAFEEFESQVFSKHGEQATPYLDLIYKTAAIKEERGVHDSGYIMFEPCKEAAMFDSLLESASKLIEAEKTAQQAKDDFEFESAYVKEARHAIGALSKKQAESEEKEEDEAEEEEGKKEEEKSEASEKDEEDPVLAEIKKKASELDQGVAEVSSADPVMSQVKAKLAEQALEKEAFGGKSLSELAYTPVADAFASAFGTGQRTQPRNTKPNLTLDNMERKLLLQELLMTDPILSKANPAKVVRAFEQILRLSPEISKEKEVVRAELRAMVASQALSKFDADLMAKTDIGLLKRRIATQEFNSGITSNFRL